MESTAKRPVGVTVIGVLAIVGGILGVVFGLLAVTAGGVVTAGADAGLGGLVLITGLITLVMGVLAIVFGAGALQLKPWAWTLGVGLYIANIIISIIYVVMGIQTIGGVIISIAIAVIILYYLFTPDVRRAFGKA